MQGAIAEALSTSEVAERIWAAAPNRFCADCGAPQPDWASINLCVVICKRCAGVCMGIGAPGRGMAGLASWDGRCPIWRRAWSGDSTQRAAVDGASPAHQGLSPVISLESLHCQAGVQLLPSQVGTRRHRERKWLVQGHLASK